MALVAGLALAVSTQSFTSVRSQTEYAFHEGEWKPLSEINYGSESGQYTCSGVTNRCRAMFDDSVDPNDPASTPIAGSVIAGNLVQNP